MVPFGTDTLTFTVYYLYPEEILWLLAALGCRSQSLFPSLCVCVQDGCIPLLLAVEARHVGIVKGLLRTLAEPQLRAQKTGRANKGVWGCMGPAKCVIYE